MSVLLIASALIGFVAVTLGAFGAHGLADRLGPEETGWWETATLYALVHAAVATAVALGARGGFIGPASGWAFLIGVLIFSGTLYLMALGGPRFLGAITPIGGLSFLVGWALVFIAGFRQA
ncbi:MAG: DUF423 domain-containing protein [Pseudomonadota bacterium]